MLYLLQFDVLWVVVRDSRIIRSTVICDNKGPSSPVTVILVTAMEDIRMGEESITSLHLNLYQGKHLSRNHKSDDNYCLSLLMNLTKL